METNRDKNTETGGTSSIRLHYSRQFQSSGHTHTIDAEAALAVGGSAEKREQILRELESSVDQLARQIVQRGQRPAGETHPQAARPSAASSRPAETPAPAPLPRPTPAAPQPTAPLPISESMPAAPTPSGERTITLPNFLGAIKKHLDISPEEARELLGVTTLTGLNYREAYDTLRALKEKRGASGAPPAQARTAQTPVVEAPRQVNRGTPAAPDTRPPASVPAPNTAPVPRAQVVAALQQEIQAMPRAPQSTPVAKPPEHGPQPDFAGSPKAPLPIQMGVVRDLAPRYAFEEEDEEEYELPQNASGNPHLQAAESKLEELKTKGGNKAASPERLNVLNTVIDGQISADQLEQIIKLAWNVTSRKRLKADQVEALISWAKEDYFVDEVNNLLELIDEEEE